jgi:hypothetical protein
LDFVGERNAERLESAFRPPKPVSWNNNEYEWLDTRNIRQVMNQYDAKYPSFKFLGVFPMDFDTMTKYGKCVEETMCRLDVGKFIRNKVKKVAAVFNLDNHDESGSHWVALYCGLDPKNKLFGTFYYDSVANHPTKEIKRLIARINEQVRKVYSKKVYSRFENRQNTIRKQFKNTECGIFAMNFIIECIKGKLTYDNICKTMGTDEEVHLYRNMFYRPIADVSSRRTVSRRTR